MWKGLFSRSQWFQSTATFTPCTPQPLSPTPTPLAPTPPVAALNPAHRYQTQRSKSSLLVLSDGQFMPKSSLCHLFGKLLFTWLSLVMSMMVSFVLSFFPRDVLDEILNLIESVSEDFPSYSLIYTWIHIPLTLNLSLFNWIIHQQHILSHFYVNKSSHVACWTICVELEDFRKRYL